MSAFDKSQLIALLERDSLKRGQFTSWDFNPNDDGREKYAVKISFLLGLEADHVDSGISDPTCTLTTSSAWPASLLWTHMAARPDRSS